MKDMSSPRKIRTQSDSQMLVITNIFNNLVIIIDIWMTWFDSFCGKNNGFSFVWVYSNKPITRPCINIRSRSLLRLLAVRVGSSTTSSREVSSAYRKVSL